jgi:hypothetical protein
MLEPFWQVHFPTCNTLSGGCDQSLSKIVAGVTHHLADDDRQRYKRLQDRPVLYAYNIPRGSGMVADRLLGLWARELKSGEPWQVWVANSGQMMLQPSDRALAAWLSYCYHRAWSVAAPAIDLDYRRLSPPGQICWYLAHRCRQYLGIPWPSDRLGAEIDRLLQADDPRAWSLLLAVIDSYDALVDPAPIRGHRLVNRYLEAALAWEAAASLPTRPQLLTPLIYGVAQAWLGRSTGRGGLCPLE